MNFYAQVTITSWDTWCKVMSIEVHVCHYMQKWPLVPKGPKRGFCLCTWAILLWYLYRPTPVGHLIGRLLYPDICAWTLWCTNSNQQQASQMFFCVQLCNVVRWCSNVDSQFAWATCSLTTWTISVLFIDRLWESSWV